MDCPWKIIWKSKVPFFIGTAVLGKILIMDNLCKKNIIVMDCCCMCKKSGGNYWSFIVALWSCYGGLEYGFSAVWCYVGDAE